MMGVLMALGWLLLTLLKLAGVLLLILLVLLALVLLCPLCADVCWEGGVLTVRAGVLGLTLPVLRWPAPEKPAGAEEPKGFWGKLKAKLRARREERKRKKAAAKEAKRPKKETAPRRKAKLTLNILVPSRRWPTGCRSASAQGCSSSLRPLCVFCMSSGAKKCWTSSYKVCYNNIVWCILLSRGSFPGK